MIKFQHFFFLLFLELRNLLLLLLEKRLRLSLLLYLLRLLHLLLLICVDFCIIKSTFQSRPLTVESGIKLNIVLLLCLLQSITSFRLTTLELTFPITSFIFLSAYNTSFAYIPLDHASCGLSLPFRPTNTTFHAVHLIPTKWLIRLADVHTSSFSLVLRQIVGIFRLLIISLTIPIVTDATSRTPSFIKI